MASRAGVYCYFTHNTVLLPRVKSDNVCDSTRYITYVHNLKTSVSRKKVLAPCYNIQLSLCIKSLIESEAELAKLGCSNRQLEYVSCDLLLTKSGVIFRLLLFR